MLNVFKVEVFKVRAWFLTLHISEGNYLSFVESFHEFLSVVSVSSEILVFGYVILFSW